MFWRYFVIITGLIIMSTVYAGFAGENGVRSPGTDCPSLEREIHEGIENLGECWKSEDCQHRFFGCPWDVSVCNYSIIGVKEDSEKVQEIDSKIMKYDGECVKNNAELKAKCDKYYQEMSQRDCTPLEPFVCLDGRCVTQSYVLYKETNDGKDIYGSRVVIEKNLDNVLENLEKEREKQNAPADR